MTSVLNSTFEIVGNVIQTNIDNARTVAFDNPLISSVGILTILGLGLLLKTNCNHISSLETKNNQYLAGFKRAEKENTHAAKMVDDRADRINIRRQQSTESFQFYHGIASQPPDQPVETEREKRINKISKRTFLGTSIGAGLMLGGIFLGPLGFPLVAVGSFVTLTHAICGSSDINKVLKAQI